MSNCTLLRSLRSAFVAAVAAMTLTSAGTSFAQPDPNPGDLILKYTAAGDAAGNLTLYFTGTGTSGTAPLSLSVLDILTLGDGNEPFGTSMPAGIPNVTAGQGALVGTPFGTKAPSLGAATELSNTSTSGLNGQYSQIYYAESIPNNSFITLDKTIPGVSDTVDLGNVAAAGWSQQNIDSIFITDTFTLYNNSNFGHFGYLVAGDTTAYIGSVQLQAVPEPSTFAGLLAGVSAMGAMGYVRRKASGKSAK